MACEYSVNGIATGTQRIFFPTASGGELSFGLAIQIDRPRKLGAQENLSGECHYGRNTAPSCLGYAEYPNALDATHGLRQIQPAQLPETGFLAPSHRLQTLDRLEAVAQLIGKDLP